MRNGSKKDLRYLLRQDAPWGAAIRFLDQINSIEEFESLVPILQEHADYENTISRYREWLTKWPDPKLTTDIRLQCRRLTARLNTPQRVRILLRAADFREVEPIVMSTVLEEILRRHENGEQRIVYKNYRGPCNKRHDALRIVYHTQLEAWTLVDLVLPDATSCGISSVEGLHVDFRSEEERKRTDNLV
jgi:hypothetical protein